ncbi:MAG: UvrD-helicase domain-containing protein, partial [Chloroflexi bacterium]|nr:UvrD-helicase domain-containing protein [Chloroflexota bacterium]
MAVVERFGYRLREQQAEILKYPLKGGLLGISSVPGSGKTQILAMLAASLIIDGYLGSDAAKDAEVLVVTVQNTAVDQISKRIRQILASENLPPVGFRVCTLHKLASDILRLRQDLAGLEEDFSIVDETEARRQMNLAFSTWKAAHSDWWESFLPDDRGDKASSRWQDETINLGLAVSKLCKHLRLSPLEAQMALVGDATPESSHSSAGWLNMGLGLYTLYARYLQTGARLDFDDLIWRALDALEQDHGFRSNLKERWPYILEDEAQDSSPLQEKILSQLSGATPNWVRVGDPNQAINSTFTSADPRFFRAFIERPDVSCLPLDESGRSGRQIIDLANHLVEWTTSSHSVQAVRVIAFKRQAIRPTGPADLQQNPLDEECSVHLRASGYGSQEKEAEAVVCAAKAHLEKHPDRSLAVLCPTGLQGTRVLEAFSQLEGAPPVDDLLKSTPKTRDVARVLGAVVNYLAEPTDRNALVGAYKALLMGRYLGTESPVAEEALRQALTLARSLQVAEYVFPRATSTIRDLLPETVALDDATGASLS